MTEIPDRPFDKIAIDLVTDCECARAQLIRQHVDTGQLNVPP